MEIYILDSLFRREHVVDRFESVVWAERWQTYGDFELKLPSTAQNRSLFQTNQHLATNVSNRVMVVESIEKSTDDEGRATLNISGRSFEARMDDRVARPDLSDLEVLPNWILTGTPSNVIKEVFSRICLLGELSPYDVMPGIVEGNVLYPPDTIPEAEGSIPIEIEPKSVYEVAKDLSETYDLGFRIVRHPVTSQLYFDVYTGTDRTSRQDDVPTVLFAPELENLQNTNELTTIANAKNVGYVLSEQGVQIVYPAGVNPDVAGYDRRAMVIDAGSVNSESPVATQAALYQKGYAELAKHRVLSAFDGEIPEFAQYKYAVDYNLGDLVEFRNAEGMTNSMRVIEQIFVSDSEGERSYPTLSLYQFITEGSWAAWDFDEFWADVPPGVYWGSL